MLVVLDFNVRLSALISDFKYSFVQLVRAWANGNVEWDFKEGGKFTLFGGTVTGRFLEIVGFLLCVFRFYSVLLRL